MWLSIELKCSHILSFFALTIKLQGHLERMSIIKQQKNVHRFFLCQFSESCPQLFWNSYCMILHLETSSFS